MGQQNNLILLARNKTGNFPDSAQVEDGMVKFQKLFFPLEHAAMAMCSVFSPENNKC